MGFTIYDLRALRFFVRAIQNGRFLWKRTLRIPEEIRHAGNLVRRDRGQAWQPGELSGLSF
jgi:hypothetical protein